jgi:ABC-type multidrug transport system permease subunit
MRSRSALALGLTLSTVLGLAVELAGSFSFQPWSRLPLLAAGLAFAAAAFGAFGVLLGVIAKETRTAALVGLLAALPIVLLGLLPEVSVAPAAWVSDAFPFSHTVRLFESTLYDASPWSTFGREVAWLLGLALLFALAARAGMRRLLT